MVDLYAFHVGTYIPVPWILWDRYGKKDVAFIPLTLMDFAANYDRPR